MVMIDANKPDRGVYVYALGDPTGGVWVAASEHVHNVRSRGDVSYFSGGVARAVTWGSKEQTVTFEISLASLEAGEKLTKWVDRAVVFRSVRGVVWCGLLRSASFSVAATLPSQYVVGSCEMTLTSEDGNV